MTQKNKYGLITSEKSCWQCKHCEERFNKGSEPLADYSECNHPAHEEEQTNRGEMMGEDCPGYEFDESLKES